MGKVRIARIILASVGIATDGGTIKERKKMGFGEKFDIDLADGEKWERHVANVIKTAEVKSDKRVGETGNLVVEFGRANYKTYDQEDSGIRTSQANYWIFNFGGEKYNGEVGIYITRKRLERVIVKYKPRAVPGGDGMRTYMWLIKKEWLLDPNI